MFVVFRRIMQAFMLLHCHLGVPLEHMVVGVRVAQNEVKNQFCWDWTIGLALRIPRVETTRSLLSMVSGSAQGTSRRQADVETPWLAASMAMMLVMAS